MQNDTTIPDLRRQVRNLRRRVETAGMANRAQKLKLELAAAEARLAAALNPENKPTVTLDDVVYVVTTISPTLYLLEGPRGGAYGVLPVPGAPECFTFATAHPRGHERTVFKLVNGALQVDATRRTVSGWC